MLSTLLLLVGVLFAGGVVLVVSARKRPPPRAPVDLSPAPVVSPPAPPAAAARPALLPKDLLMDRVGGDLDLLGELAVILRRDTPGRLLQMREAARAGDAATLARATHALRGALGNVCAPHVFQAATELEEASRSGGGDAEALVAIDALGRDVDSLHMELDLLLRSAV